MDSPIANVVWCRSSLRLNSTGSDSAALWAPLAQAAITSGEALGVVVAQLVDAGVQALERPAVRRQHQRVGRQRTQAFERVEVEPQRVGLGLEVDHHHVGRMRGSTMSPEISVASAAQCSAMCSGAWP